MKKWILLSLVIVSFNVRADMPHLEAVCQSVMPAGGGYDNYVPNTPYFDFKGETLFVARRLSNTSHVVEKIEGASHQRIFQTQTRLIGVSEYKDHLWLLTPDHLIEISQNGKELSRFYLSHSSGHNARYMTRQDNHLFITQGAAGVVKFDIETRQQIWRSTLAGVNSGGNLSTAISAAADDRDLYVLMAGSTPKAFNGVVRINAEDGQIIHTAAYHQRNSGVISSRANVKISGRNMIINNGGWIHLTNIDQINSHRTVSPRWRPVPVNAPNLPHYMMLEGEFFMQEKTLYGCGIESRMINGQRLLLSSLYRIPLNIR
jgi:hypothetical protein